MRSAMNHPPAGPKWLFAQFNLRRAGKRWNSGAALVKNHDRHDGNHEAMRAYLRWETELPAEIARDGLAGFRLQPN